MAYQEVEFIGGELVPATKLNQLMNNDKSFRDGSGFTDGAIAASKLDLSSIPDGAIAASQLDLSSLPNVDIVVTDGGIFEYTAPVDGQLLLIGTINATWGFAGNSIRLGWTKRDGSATVASTTTSVLSGGDTVGRTVVVAAKISFKAGETIQMALERIEGAYLGNTAEYNSFGLFIPNN